MDNLDFIISELLKEQALIKISRSPENKLEKRKLMRSLMNLRHTAPISEHILNAQDAELSEQLLEKGIIELNQTHSSPIDNRFNLWQGDITRLKADVIVNAANSQMLGCFVPQHGCIDNAIHSAAGIQMRLECNELMKKQGYPEPSGSAKITKGYNLPSKYVIHTVGPIIEHIKVTTEDEYQLASCYQSCLKLADENKLRSIAFCCISTGEYRFPHKPAAEIAIRTVRKYFDSNHESGIETVVFNVFKDIDYSIYGKLLQTDQE